MTLQKVATVLVTLKGRAKVNLPELHSFLPEAINIFV